MKRSISYIKETVFGREIRRIIHDKDLVLIFLIVPLFYIFFYGAVYKNKVINQLHVAFIDMDHSSISRMIKKEIMADPVLKVQDYVTLDNARHDMELQKVQAILYVPADLEKNLKRGKKVGVPVYITTTNFMVNIEANKRIGSILQHLSYGVIAKYWMSKGYIKKAALIHTMPLNVDIHPLGNAVYSYGDFVLVGLMVLIIQQLLLIGVGESTAKENEEKTFSEWIQAAKGSVGRMVAGKVLLYLIFFGVYFLFVSTIGFSVFSIAQKGSIFILGVFAVPFLIAVAGLSLFLGTFFGKKIQALQFLAVTSVPIFLMVGYSWPYYVLPIELKVISLLFPTYWMMMSYQNVTQLGAPFITQLKYLIVLIIQALIYMGLAYWRVQHLKKETQ